VRPDAAPTLFRFVSENRRTTMAFKPNYRQQRGDRNRAKMQKQQEKLELRDEAAAKRRAEHDDPPPAQTELPETVNDGKQ
jgi:hypothetical protein